MARKKPLKGKRKRKKPFTQASNQGIKLKSRKRAAKGKRLRGSRRVSSSVTGTTVTRSPKGKGGRTITTVTRRKKKRKPKKRVVRRKRK